MAYANLTPNLQDMFAQINDRLRKLESGPNSAQTAADAAQSTADTAYTKAAGAIQRDSYNTFNASNQLTAINGNGITVYAGASPTSGARVVLNSAGLAGVNSSGTTTFAIDASTGNASFNGTITSVAGSIGGLTITPTSMTSGSLILDSTGNITSTNTAFLKYISVNGGTLGTYHLAVQGDSGFYGTITTSGNFTAQAYIYNTGAATTTSSANVFMNSSSGLIARVTSSERYKVEITPEAIPAQSVMALVPKSYVDKAEYEANNNSATGLPRYLGLIAEDLAQLPVLKDLLVNYNEEGQPDSVNYDRIAIALVPLIQDLNNRLTALEAK